MLTPPSKHSEASFLLREKVEEWLIVFVPLGIIILVVYGWWHLFRVPISGQVTFWNEGERVVNDPVDGNVMGCEPDDQKIRIPLYGDAKSPRDITILYNQVGCRNGTDDFLFEYTDAKLGYFQKKLTCSNMSGYIAVCPTKSGDRWDGKVYANCVIPNTEVEVTVDVRLAKCKKE